MNMQDGSQAQLSELVRNLIENEELENQLAIRERLKSRFKVEVNQSSISRALSTLGAIKIKNEAGQSVYQLPSQQGASRPVRGQVQSVKANQSMIVLRTQPGSASLVALAVENYFGHEILGTIAGDDTVFVAPKNQRGLSQLRQQIEALSS